MVVKSMKLAATGFVILFGLISGVVVFSGSDLLAQMSPEGSQKAVNGSVRKESDRQRVVLKGEITKGERFEAPFGSRFRLILNPTPHGWLLVIRDERGDEDIARLTPPWHGVPNPREIEGWHFRNADNTGPNEAGEGNVNAPGNEREFIFSPAVGRTVDGPDARKKPDHEDVEAVRQNGQGVFKIVEYLLVDLKPKKQAGFQWIRFEVELSWRQ
jgi:hypothetical protein